MASQFILISGRVTSKREAQQSSAVASPVAAEAASSAGEADADAVDTSERFGLIGSLIAKHKMRQAMKHGMMPFPPVPLGPFGFPG